MEKAIKSKNFKSATEESIKKKFLLNQKKLKDLHYNKSKKNKALPYLRPGHRDWPPLLVWTVPLTWALPWNEKSDVSRTYPIASPHVRHGLWRDGSS